MRWRETAGLQLDALDLKRARLSAIRTVFKVAGHTRQTLPQEQRWPAHSAVARLAGTDHPRASGPISVPAEAPVFANAVGKSLHRTLFRARVWRPALVRAGMLGTLTVIDENTVRAGWTDDTGATLAKEFATKQEAIMHIGKSCTGGLCLHDLRHSYATWLDDGVPVNMVQRVTGHEQPSTQYR